MAANRITDYYRSKSYKKEKLQQPLQWETEEEKTVRDLAEHMVQKEEIRRIMDIVVSYEREWIRIFQKKCFEEKTFAQIAEEMDLAESTVKTRFYPVSYTHLDVYKRQVFEQINQEIDDVGAAVQGLEGAVGILNSNKAKVVDRFSDISSETEELAASSQDILGKVDQQSVEMENIHTAIESLHNVVTKLNEIMDQFTV